jgi:cell division protein FtsN
LRAADPEWRSPETGTALEYAWRAVCDPGFRGPFQVADVKASAPEAAAPTPGGAMQRAEAVATPAVGASGRAAGIVAQVGASASNAEAKSLLAALGGRADGRRTWVEQAEVGGRTWYRAVVGGFADSADAQAFCARLKAGGRPCFLRKPG